MSQGAARSFLAGVPSRRQPRLDRPATSSAAEPTPTVSPSTELPTAASSLAAGPRELAEQVLLDIDQALAIERNTSDDAAFTAAIAAWFANEYAYLEANQAVLAADDEFATLGHPLLVIQDVLTMDDPVVLRMVVRELDDERATLEAIR